MSRPVVVSGAPARPPRSTQPAMLPGATRFSDEPASFIDATRLVRRVKRLQTVMDILAKAEIDHNHGPRRGPGNWPLLYLAYVIGKEANLQPWYRRESQNTALFAECGFQHVPAYPTVWERFCELEEHAEVFHEAACELILMARQCDARVGMWWSVDGTECQTHAQPHHDCGPNDDCPTRTANHEPRLKRVSSEDAANIRGADSAVEDRADRSIVAAAPPPTQGGGLDPVPERAREEVEDGVRFTSGGHWWKTRDREAGTSSYGKGRAWFGNMNIKAVDVFTGAALAIEIAPAHEMEAHALPRLYERGLQAVGTDPIAMIADRGYATDEVHHFLMRRDVTPVIPYRKRHASSPAQAEEGARFDRHGIPKCRHCGEPGDFVRFSEKGSSPRLWFRCALPSTPDCQRVQTISCSESVRRLLPMWRTSETYQALRSQMGVYERVHEDFRTHFRSGGKNLRERPRRIGIACQQLRANAALVVQWIWVMYRQGWLGSRPEREQAKPISGARWRERIMKARWRESLIGGSYPTRGAPPPVAAGP